MPDGVFAIFVDPRVFLGHVHVSDLFSLGGIYAVVKRGRSTPSAKKRLARMDGCGQGERLDKVAEVWIGFLEFFPLTLPHFYDGVPQLT